MQPSSDFKAVQDAHGLFQTIATVADHFGLTVTAAAARHHMTECEKRGANGGMGVFSEVFNDVFGDFARGRRPA